MPSIRASLAVAALAGVLALASASGSALLAGGVALVVLLFTLGAVSAAGVHSARWAGVVALAAGGGALAWTYLEETSDLTPIAALLAPTIVASIVVQLWRRDGRPRLTASLAYSVSACVLAVLPVGWLALQESTDGRYSVGLALLGIGAVGLAEAFPVSRAGRRFGGVLVAALAAGALVMWVRIDQVGETVPAVSAVVVATFGGLMAAIAFAVVDRLEDELATAPVPVPSRVAPVSVDAPSSGPPSVQQVGAEPGDVPVAGEVDGEAAPRGAAAFVPLRISLPFVAAAPVAYVLGRIFVS